LATQHLKNRFNGKKCVFLSKKGGRERVNKKGYFASNVSFFPLNLINQPKSVSEE